MIASTPSARNVFCARPCALRYTGRRAGIVGRSARRRSKDGSLVAWKKRNGGKSPVAVPEFGADAFINPDFQEWTDLYAKKGASILRVAMPKGAQSIESVKAIARKALPRL